MSHELDAQDPLLEALRAGRVWAILPERLAAIYQVDLHQSPFTVSDSDFEALKDRGRGRRATGGAVAIIPLHGMITPKPSLLAMLFGNASGGLEGFRAALGEALGDPEVKSIALDIDSPGGLVDQVPETAQMIREARKQKPVVAIANPLAASAAYWLGSQATRMVASTSGQAGSIGIYQLHQDVSAKAEMMGVKPTMIAAGKYKVEGNPFEPLAPEARGTIQSSVDDYYELFVKDVASGRGTSQRAVRNGYGQGRVLTAARAREAGLVDDVRTLDEVVSELASGHVPARATAVAEVSDQDQIAAMTYTVEDKQRIFAVLGD